MIWKFAAPRGNRFAGGVATIRGSLMVRDGAAPLPEAAIFAAVGTKLALSGGGDLFKPFNAYNVDAFVRRPIDVAKRNADQQVQLEIPAGCEEFFLAVTRAAMKDSTAQFAVRSIAIEPKFQNPRGLTIHCDRDEPLWSTGESIALRAVASGEPQANAVVWTLSRRDGTIEKQDQVRVVNGAAEIDLSGNQAGFYKLAVAEASQPDTPLDSQELVILRAQDPKITSADSIFGAFEAIGYVDLARRMGVKWDVMARLWAWAQRAPDAPIEFGIGDSVHRARECGLEPIVLIDTAPPWSNGGREHTVPPLESFHEKWRAFNEAVARAYAGKATWYQSWNEPRP